MIQTVRPPFAAIGAALLGTLAQLHAASIQSLGDFPDSYWSRATALSADGSTVVGVSYGFDGSRRAFRWSAVTGLTDLGSLNNATDNATMAISGDGSMSAGFSGSEGFRATPAGLQNLGHLIAGGVNTPLGMSADGSLIVGSENSLPFLWRATSGISALPTLAGAPSGQAGAISPDGTFIAGNLGLNLVRWIGTTPSVLATFSSDLYVAGNSLSSEGTVIGGRVLRAGANTTDAIAWVEGVGVRVLPDLPGGDPNAALLGLTADGLTGVGIGSDIPFWTTATVWAANGPAQRLEDILAAQGVDLSYWYSLDEAFAISPDGRFIVGSGTVGATFLQEAFIAEITPLPAPAQPPFNNITRSLPGRIQAEDFDNGGPLVAYVDTTAGNPGNLYRTEGVDLVSNTITTGGVSAKISAREWTEYTVNVTFSGPAVMRFQVATPSTGSTIKALLGAPSGPMEPVLPTLSLPRTGSANTYTLVEADVTLSAGTRVLRICGAGPDFCLNAVEIVPRGTFRELWTGASGTRTSQIPTTRAANQTSYLSTLETPANTGDNYGIRLRSYLRAPATGSYRFWIASDNDSDLYLSTTSSAANRRRIANVSGSTNQRQWNRYASQRSASISLVAGQLYYIEVLQKESTGSDHVSVGWSRPGQAITAPSEIIPNSVLSAFVP